MALIGSTSLTRSYVRMRISLRGICVLSVNEVAESWKVPGEAAKWQILLQKYFWGDERKFFRAAHAFYARRCEGPCRFIPRLTPCTGYDARPSATPGVTLIQINRADCPLCFGSVPAKAFGISASETTLQSPF
jgi:hypothetical protein